MIIFVLNKSKTTEEDSIRFFCIIITDFPWEISISVDIVLAKKTLGYVGNPIFCVFVGISLCSPDWLGTPSEDHAGLELV